MLSWPYGISTWGMAASHEYSGFSPSRRQHPQLKTWTKHLFRVNPLHGSIVTKPLPIFCVPKRNPIVLASAMIEPHHTNANNNENDINHEVIHGIEENQGV
jgi:hypothetical protein